MIGPKIETTRRLIEMAYLHAWGSNGSANIRDDFRTNFADWKPQLGNFTYNGYNFSWDFSTGSKKKMTEIIRRCDMCGEIMKEGPWAYIYDWLGKSCIVRFVVIKSNRTPKEVCGKDCLGFIVERLKGGKI